MCIFFLLTFTQIQWDKYNYYSYADNKGVGCLAVSNGRARDS